MKPTRLIVATIFFLLDMIVHVNKVSVINKIAYPSSAGYFYTITRDGIVRISHTGEKKLIVGSYGDSYTIEVFNNEIYVSNQTYGGAIVVFDVNGNYHRTISTPSEASEYLDIVTLPDGRIALLDNHYNKVYFISSTGNLLQATSMLDGDDGQLQNLDGIVVNNELIISNDGIGHVIKINLDTYQMSIFKDLNSLPYPHTIGAITYYDGKYYILHRGNEIYSFEENSDLTFEAEVPNSTITGIVVIGNTAYGSSNYNGRIYKTNLETGVSSIITSGLNYPKDMKYQGPNSLLAIEARLDIGMPYDYETNRGCSSPYLGCGGPYHGFYKGVCTDLVIDSYQYGVPFDLVASMKADFQANPHGYWHRGSARNAHDMFIYFQHTGQLLSHDQSYNIGDIAFFQYKSGDWHVGVITEVDENNRPTSMTHAPGCTWSCDAIEENWNTFYTAWSQGHGRLNSIVGNMEQISGNFKQTLVLSVDAPATIKLFDSRGDFTSSEFNEALVASNIEDYIPYIRGGYYESIDGNAYITVTQPISNTTDYLAQVTGVSAGSYHLRIWTIQGDTITASEMFTNTISVGETHRIDLALDEIGGTIGFNTSSPTLSPQMDVTPSSIELVGPASTTTAITIAVSETGGQLPLERVDVSVSNVENQLGQGVSGTQFIIIPSSFDVPAGNSQSFLIRIDLANIQPGLYQGGLLVVSSNGGTLSIPLSLTVEPLRVFLPLVTRDVP